MTDFLNTWLLTILIFLPCAGAMLLLLLKGRDTIRWTALGTTILTFVLSLLLFFTFDYKAGSKKEGTETVAKYAYVNDGGNVQMVTHAAWIPAFNIEYRVGIDGLSFPLVILSTFICMLACIASWKIDKMTKGYMCLFLFLETGILGVFLSLDFFLFYVFFEVSLLPMYFLIGIWGGPRKEYAAIKFFLYTLVGSIGLLIVLIGLFLYSRQILPAATPAAPAGTFDMVRMATQEFQAALGRVIPGGLAGATAKTFFM